MIKKLFGGVTQNIVIFQLYVWILFNGLLFFICQNPKKIELENIKNIYSARRAKPEQSSVIIWFFWWAQMNLKITRQLKL